MANQAKGCGGIVLCGGKSSRMGQDKAWLPFGPEPMLARIVSIVSEAVHPVVVVAAPGQQLPELPRSVQIVFDRSLHAGPLEGLACGLTALDGIAEAAYVTGCDLPLLRPELILRTIELRGDYAAAAPWIDGVANPLAAVYSTELLPVVETLLAAGKRAPRLIFEHASTRRITREELAHVDSDLHSLLNVNDPAAYEAALKLAGY